MNWNPFPKAGLEALAGIALLLAASTPALATKGPPAASRYASIVMDAETGAVLYERNADLPRYPASLTKIMTLYLTFEALASKKLSLTDMLPVSAFAAGHDPSRLDLAPGSKLKVEDAIRSITTKSANDAAAVLAEHLAKGSEKKFSEMMTAKGKALGMKQTTFHNASGLPDEGHLSSARDLAVLSRALIRDFPQYYPYCSTLSFDFKGTRFPNQNRFLRTYYGADGIKTGFVNASGHNLAASAVRGGKRLIAIVLGGDSQAWTREHTTRLLDVSYAKIDPTLAMVASNASGAAPATAAPGVAQPAPAQTASAQTANAAAPAAAPVVYATPAGAVTIASSTAAAASGPSLPLPNATANLAAYAAATASPKAAPAAAAPAAKPATAPAPAAATANAAKPAAPVTPPTTLQAVASARAAATTPPPVAAHVLEKAPPPAKPTAATAAAAPAPAARPATPAPSAAGETARAEAAPHSPQPAPSETDVDRKLAAARPAPAPAAEPAATKPPSQSASAPAPAEKATPAPAQEETSATKPGAKGGDWAVQVGMFRDAQVARRRGEEARAQMPLPLRGADLVVARANDGVHVVSRIASLSEADAREACSQLQRGRVPCVVVPPGRPLLVATN